MAGFVAFQSWQIWVLTRTFRKKPVAQGDTDENAFTFGQILVLFMVVPLIGDFTAALMGMLSNPKSHARYKKKAIQR